MDAANQPRVALIHDWLTGMRGGEKCLEPLARRWPHASLHTLLHRRGSVSAPIERLRPRASFLQRFPFSHRYYRFLLPLMPLAVRTMRLPPVDLVVSFSHCVAKGAMPPAGVPHVCYCFTPMRYAWGLRQAYFGGRLRGLPARLLDRALDRLRDWDRATASRVTHFIAISNAIRDRIRACYDRDSVVIYPPVETDFYTPAPVQREDFYLAVSAFAPYKRLDLAIAACARLRRKLVVIGAGQDAVRLRTLAGMEVQMLGWRSDAEIRDHMRRCRALLFPGEEDFGIVPVEAMACGTPVIAYGKGGALETVVPAGGSPEPTGVLFTEQTAEGLADAMLRFEREAETFSPTACRQQALRFSRANYEQELFAYIDGVLASPSRERKAA